jgi:hypothetical protein
MREDILHHQSVGVKKSDDTAVHLGGDLFRPNTPRTTLAMLRGPSGSLVVGNCVAPHLDPGLAF